MPWSSWQIFLNFLSTLAANWNGLFHHKFPLIFYLFCNSCFHLFNLFYFVLPRSLFLLSLKFFGPFLLFLLHEPDNFSSNSSFLIIRLLFFCCSLIKKTLYMKLLVLRTFWVVSLISFLFWLFEIFYQPFTQIIIFISKLWLHLGSWTSCPFLFFGPFLSFYLPDFNFFICPWRTKEEEETYESGRKRNEERRENKEKAREKKEKPEQKASFFEGFFCFDLFFLFSIFLSFFSWCPPESLLFFGPYFLSFFSFFSLISCFFFFFSLISPLVI